jgi:hypothetical protein
MSANDSMRERVERDLLRMRQDPFFAGFVPETLGKSDAAVQRLVAFLYRELSGGHREGARQLEWVRTLELAALGHVQAQSELAALMAAQDNVKG